jgi:N-acetylmuramoyl-L-alanine amidase
MRRAVWCATLLVGACGGSRAGIAPPTVAPSVGTAPSRARGPLRIAIVYPSAADVVQPTDSEFILGSTGSGDARLTVAGVPVPVAPTGGWIAWIPLPDDTAYVVPIVARTATDSQFLEWRIRIAPRFHPPLMAAWIDTGSFEPAGSFRWPAGEGMRLAVRAAPGSSVRLLLRSGKSVPLVPDSLPEEPSWGLRAFGTDTQALHLPAHGDRYVGWLAAEPIDSSALLEVINGADTTRAVWPLELRTLDPTHPEVIVLDDDTARTGTTDSLTVGKAVPYGTYQWFFPTGTRAVQSGVWNDQVRLALSATQVAWVNSADVHQLPAGTPPPGGVVGSVRLTAGPHSVTLRVPLPDRLPYRVEEGDRTLALRIYGGTSDVNWMQYGPTDSLVRRMSYLQETRDELVITLELSRRVWGYRTRFDGRDLLLEVRRPPIIDPTNPLRGRTVVLDPGHPPVGATGPTGVREPAVTLAVALKAKTLLERAGATVLLTRRDSSPVDLYPRTKFAELHDADVLVSIHANALPDGVNPFINNGTSVYYFHPRSADLGRALDQEIAAALGLRDLGLGRGDYALVRPTWMPAALTEGAFMMLPDQEALLASDDGQWRYARGVARGIEDFLRQSVVDLLH